MNQGMGLKTAKFVSMSLIVSLTLVVASVVGLNLYSSFKGYKLYNISTPSMEPNLSVGSLIMIDPSNKTPKFGDVITFKPYENSDMTVTHRFIGETVKHEEKHMITKGDSNEKPDSPVSYKGLVGVESFSVPHLGNILENKSKYLKVIVGLYVISGFTYFISDILDKKKDKVK